LDRKTLVSIPGAPGKQKLTPMEILKVTPLENYEFK